ncbi:MAG: glutamyl-tRNA reductase [Ignavibacteriales bacterium]|nr:glutamyl-tRNA reductase [Ignavibacteriales bacterium]MCF8306234.1 glutamyl-tRNA reductase [Ignavibacteriales bacterium]MCF8315955.1 glutamyl-tRNA reductase [Ignavibacteriales bacterium]MCF8437549.1 glutamyl-tRNA reductase [Ignavibacteriales bacterium]
MFLIGISINHKTAPIEFREAVHLSETEITELTEELRKSYFKEGFILSTCNRTEIFGVPKDIVLSGYTDIIELLIRKKAAGGLTKENFRQYFSCGAVKHIFSVASGIDSLIIGDSQILGQVKTAFDHSHDMNFAGPVLKRLFDTTLKVGKRAIKETSIGEGAVTVSYAAVQVVEKIFANLEKRSALIIGAGETGELAATNLFSKGVYKIDVANRTLSRAEELAKKIHGGIVPFEFLNEHVHQYDIIISATSSEELILTQKDVANMMKRRKGAPVVIMDIAIPRDIDPQVAKIDNVFYHDMDSLQVVVQQNLKKREKEIPIVEKMIMEEMTGFFGWYNTLEVVPTIRSLRDFFEDIRSDELNKIKNKVTEDDFIKLEDMTRRMIGRLLHNPTINLREIAETGTNVQEISTRTMIIKELFGLDSVTGTARIDKSEK